MSIISDIKTKQNQMEMNKIEKKKQSKKEFKTKKDQ
jgi:hypothetical protein